MRSLLKHFSLALLAILILGPATALAEEVAQPNPTLALPAAQVWTLLIGSLVPLVSYVINFWAPWVDEKIKSVVFIVVPAIAGALYQQLEFGGLGFNTPTIQVVGSAVISALFAHKLLWKPSTISTALGGGRDIQDNPAH